MAQYLGHAMIRSAHYCTADEGHMQGFIGLSTWLREAGRAMLDKCTTQRQHCSVQSIQPICVLAMTNSCAQHICCSQRETKNRFARCMIPLARCTVCVCSPRVLLALLCDEQESPRHCFESPFTVLKISSGLFETEDYVHDNI